MNTGVVKFFDQGAGWGFITSSNNEDIFVHFDYIRGQYQKRKQLTAGDEVEFSVAEVERKGKNQKQAREVRIVNNVRKHRRLTA